MTRWGTIAFASLLCLWGTVEFLAYELHFQQTFRDQFSISEQLVRFEGVRDIVPADAVLGYVTDRERGSAMASAMFGEAQYALAPRILQWGDGHEWVLGNFSKPFSGGETAGLK